MKRLMDALRSAQKIELFLIAALLCVLVLLGFREPASNRSSTATTEEMRMQQALSEIEGVGRVSVVLAEDKEENLQGVLVIAGGADNVRTYLEIQRAVKTLTGLELSQIEIVKSGK